MNQDENLLESFESCLVSGFISKIWKFIKYQSQYQMLGGVYLEFEYQIDINNGKY